MELVGLDVTNHVRVTRNSRTSRPRGQSGGGFWDAVLDANDWFIDSGEYYFWDVLAAWWSLTGSATAAASSWRSAQLPRDRYALVADLGSQHARYHRGRPPRRHFDAATAGELLRREGAANVLFCRETDAEAAFARNSSTR
jgi:hypothetical protein